MASYRLKTNKTNLDWVKSLCYGGCHILLPSNMTNFAPCDQFLVHAKGLALVVRRVDNAIHRIIVDKTNYAIHWIVIYPVDSV
jgi:hypothetical protein